LESIKIATILSVPFCLYHFVRTIWSNTILSGHRWYWIDSHPLLVRGCNVWVFMALVWFGGRWWRQRLGRRI